MLGFNSRKACGYQTRVPLYPLCVSRSNGVPFTKLEKNKQRRKSQVFTAPPGQSERLNNARTLTHTRRHTFCWAVSPCISLPTPEWSVRRKGRQATTSPVRPPDMRAGISETVNEAAVFTQHRSRAPECQGLLMKEGADQRTQGQRDIERDEGE